MKTKLVLIITMLSLTGCAHGQNNTAAGAAIGAVAGTAIGAHNKNPLVGAVTGALVGGLVGNAIDQNQQPRTQVVEVVPAPPPIPSVPPPDVIVKETPVVVVETPVVIDERIWVGNDLWIYSYHGYRQSNGHIRYQSRVPFHRVFIRGGHGYRR